MPPLPPAEAARVDAVIHAAGPSIFPALAALCSAIGFILARRCVPCARNVVLAAMAAEIQRAAALHDQPQGQG